MGSSSISSLQLAAALLLMLTAAQAATSTITVVIRNSLEGGQEAGVQCAPRGFYVEKRMFAHDILYEFEFKPEGDGDLFICAFDFDGMLHWFDIYVATRDYATCGANLRICSWKIVQNGPCFEDSQTCYKWDHTSIGSHLPCCTSFQ